MNIVQCRLQHSSIDSISFRKKIQLPIISFQYMIWAYLPMYEHQIFVHLLAWIFVSSSPTAIIDSLGVQKDFFRKKRSEECIQVLFKLKIFKLLSSPFRRPTTTSFRGGAKCNENYQLFHINISPVAHSRPKRTEKEEPCLNVLNSSFHREQTHAVTRYLSPL